MTTANEYEKLVKNVVENKTVHWADSPLSREGGGKEKNSWLLRKMSESGFPDASGREEG
jgi:hypothetical protein